MRYALIATQTGIVENVVELTAEWPEDQSWALPPGHFAVPSETAGTGDTYDAETKQFTRPAATQPAA